MALPNMHPMQGTSFDLRSRPPSLDEQELLRLAFQPEVESRDWPTLARDLSWPDARVHEEQLFTAAGQPAGRLLAISPVGDDPVERRQMKRRKDEFLAVLAHELRNPLAPLRNGVHLARVVGTGDSGLKSLLAMMERQIGVLTRLVDDLLDVSRIGSGKLQLAAAPLSLRELLGDSCELMHERLAASAHALRLNLCDDPCVVLGDRDRLHQVGVGLLGEELQNIFNMYSQVRLHKARAQGGLGIGLALVRRLIELHGGSVEATSEGRGKGSTFSVVLPLQPRPS